MDVVFYMEALKKAMVRAKPQIFNSDQGSQYTSTVFTQRLLEAEIQISMDGKGRCFDNIFIERLWRTLKDYTDGHAHHQPASCGGLLGLGKVAARRAQGCAP